MREITMKRTSLLTIMVLGALVTLAGCSSDSPTSPPASPTPTAFSISLTASPTEAVVNSPIVVAARVTSGGQNVADGTSVTFSITGCVPNSATTPHFENGTCEMVRTTQGGGATAVVVSEVDGAFEVKARVPNASAALVVRFYQPTDPQTLALYSITPTRGPATGGQQVTIRGRGFAKPLVVAFVVGGTPFTAQIVGVNATGTELTAITPPVNPETATAEQTASLQVTAAAGTASEVQATMASAYVFEKKFTDPRIYQIVPASGLTTGGEPVTIYGANFVAPVKVVFGGEDAQVVSVSADGGQIHVLTPHHSGTVPSEGQAVDVTVYTRYATAQQQLVTRASGFTWLPPVTNPGAPLIYSVIPNRGSARGGEEVTILGANLCGEVVTATGQCYSLPTVSFQIGAPVNATRAAEVLSVTPDGRSLRIRTPQATPNPLTADAVAAVIVTNAAGSYTAAGAFTYLHETSDPQLFLVQPNRGSPRGGEEVRLIGRNFTPPVLVEFVIGAPLNVTYPAEVLSVNSDGTEIRILTPQASPNPVTTDVNVAIRITTMVGSANSRTNTFNNAFTYVGEARPPVIYYLDPDKGSREGREKVTVYGRYFIRPVRVVFEGVGDAEVTDVAADGSTITILTPPARITLPADGKVDVTVTSEAGTGREQQVTLRDGFQYREAESPEIYSLAPNSGPIEGGTRVTINGRGFQYPVQVLFNVMGSDRQAQVVSVNYTTIVCISPSITATHPTTPIIAQVRVVNALTGQGSASLPFRYGDAMFISAILPASGPDLGGQQVTIFGQGFVAPVAVTIAGVAAQPLSVSGTEIVVLTGAPVERSCTNRTGTVVVTNINSGISAVGPTYTYTPARPLITRVEVVKQGVNTGDNVVQQYDPLGVVGCHDANHPPYDQYEVIVYGENFERRPNSTNSAMTVIFENPAVEVLTTWISPTEIRFQLPDLSQVRMAQAACTSGGVVGTRDIPTGLPFTVKNNNNSCEDRLNPALILEPCDPTCRVGAIQVDLTPDQLTLGVGTSAVMTVCINSVQSTNTQVIISQSGPSGVVTFDPDGPGGQPAAPAITVTIPAGAACTTFYVNGLTGGGPVAVTASLPVNLGGDTDTSQVTVGALGILLTPKNLNLPVGGNGSLTIQLSSPAPAGGAQVTVQLAGPAGVIDLDWAGDPGDPPNDTTFTITIPQGSSTYTFTCEGLTAGGPVTVSATLDPGLGGASDSSTVFVGQYTVTLSPEDLLLAPGGVGNFTVTIDSPAPPGGLTVTITQTGLSGVISTPASVFIAAGTQSATFQVNALSAGGPIVVTVTLPASVGGASDSSTVTVAAYTISLDPASMNLSVGQTGNFTVTLNRPASPAAITVTLTQTGPSGVISIPATVTINAGDTTASFQVTALTQGGPVTITASLPPSLNALPDTATVTVGPMSLTAIPTALTVPVGGTGTFILNLSIPAPANITVTATSGNPGVATVTPPAAPHFTTGTTSTAAFTVTGVALGTTTIYCQLPAAYGGGTAQVAITVANYQLTAIPSSLSLIPGGTGTFVLQLNQPAPAGGATITLASSNPQAATLSVPTITIPGGATQSAAVTVTGVNVGSSTITATLPAAMGGSAANVQVTVANYTLTAVPASVVVAPGGTATFVAQLNQPAPAGGLTVTAQSSNTLVATVAPATFTIAGGGTVTGSFTVTGVSAGTTTITLSLPASVGGATATVNVTVANYTLTPVPASVVVAPSGTATFVAQLNQPAPAGGLTVTAQSNNTLIATVAPATLTILGGGTVTGNFTVNGIAAGNTTITLSLPASVGGATATVNVTVASYTLTAIPTSLNVPWNGWNTFVLQLNQAAPAGGLVANLSSSNTFITQPTLTQPLPLVPAASVTIPAGSLTSPVIYAYGSNIGTATIYAQLASTGATAQVAVNVVNPLQFVPAALTVPVGSQGTFTLQLATALSSPTLVNLDYSGTSGAVAGPASVTIPANSTTVTFNVFGVKPTTTAVSIVATLPSALPYGLGGATATGNVTVTGAPYTLTITPSPLTLSVGGTATMTASFNYPLPPASFNVLTYPFVLALTMSSPGSTVLQINGVGLGDDSVSFAAGQTSGTFTVTGVSNGGPITISGTGPVELGGPTASAAVTVGPGTATLTMSPNPLMWLQSAPPPTITLSISPVQGTNTIVQLQSSNPSVVTVPSTATIPAGSSSTTFTPTVVGTGTATITATPPWELAPPPVGVSAAAAMLASQDNVTIFTASVSPASLTLPAGGSGTLTINLSHPLPAALSGVTIAAPAYVSVPSPVTIPAGVTSFNVPVTAVQPGTGGTITVTMPASVGGLALAPTPSVTVSALNFTLTVLSNTVYVGTSTTATVTTASPVPFDTTVTVTDSGGSGDLVDLAVAPVIPAGATTVTFPVTGLSLGSPRTLQAALPASLNATPQTVAMTIANLPLDLTPEGPVPVYKGTTQSMTVTIPQPRNAATTVTLALNGASTGTATFPASVTIPTGNTSASFTVTPGNTGSAIIDATLPASLNALAGPHDSETLNITDLTLTLTPNPLTLAPGQSGTMTATIPVALGSDTVVTLVNNGGLGEFTIPASVTIPTGALSAHFTVTALATTGTGTVEGNLPAALNAGATPHATATVNVVTLPLVMSPDTVGSLMAGGGQIFTLTIPTAQSTPTSVTLSSSNPAVFSVPASVVIPAGQTSVNFTGIAEAVGGPVTITATLPAALGSGSDTSTITTVAPLTVAAAPNVINNPAATDETVTVSVGTTLAKNVTLTLTSLDVLVAGLHDGATPPAGTWSLLVPAGSNSATIKVRGVGVGTTQVEVNAPAALNPAAGPEATINVQIVALQLTLTPTNVATSVGAWAPVTVTLTNLSGGTVVIPVQVNLTVSANPGNLDLDWDTNPGGQGDTLTLTIPVGSNSALFYVYGQANGSAQVTAQLDAIFGGGTAQATVGIAPGAPIITSIQVAPHLTAAAPTGGGAYTVNIYGSNFVAPLTSVTFNGVAEPTCTIFNFGLITCTNVPANPAGTYPVVVTTAAGSGTYPTFRYYATPTVTSVTPNVGKTSGGDSVTVNGTNFLPGGVYVVLLGGSSCTGATATSTTTITCTTPAQSAGTYGVTVTDEVGQTASLAGAFTYLAPPTITALQNPAYSNQAIGQAGGGETVNIIGANFQNVGTYWVTFDGLAAVAATYVNATTLSVTTPAYGGGSSFVDVVVTDPAGQTGSLAGTHDFAYYAAPTITSSTPTAGPSAGGTTLTLNGTFLAGGSYTVVIDPLGVPAACSVILPVTATQINCTTGAHAAGLGFTIQVTDATSQTAVSPQTFDYYAPPTTTGIAPSAGPSAGGTAITITGTFLAGGSYTVDIGGSACTGVTATAAQITCTTGAHSAALGATVTVTDAVGQSDSGQTFDYYAPPTVTGLNPLSGSINGFTSLTLQGSFLAGGTYTVNIGGSSCGGASATATTITCTTGAHAVGAATVTVTDAVGQFNNSQTFTYTVGFSFSSVTSANTPTGSFVSGPGGINCVEPTSGTCSATYSTTPVTFTPTAVPPDAGWSWGGSCAACAANSNCTLALTTDPMSCTLAFN
jgi:hypothetical protein